MFYSPSEHIFITTKSVIKDKDCMIVEVLLNCVMEEEFKFTFMAQKIDHS